MSDLLSELIQLKLDATANKILATQYNGEIELKCDVVAESNS